MTDKINIKKLNKADVLAVLYNASRPQGMGFMAYDHTPMTREQAQELLDSGKTKFDYLKGRVMKIDLSGDQLDIWAYDRDNGQGTAQDAINSLCSEDNTNPMNVAEAHKTATLCSAQDVKGRLHEKTRYENGVFDLGLYDVAEPLNKAVDDALKKIDDLKQ